jgi:hypothetical protein
VLDLPQLAITETCPDPDCNAKIGEKHAKGCGVAICITTGQQRLIHETVGPDADESLPSGLDVHTCGEDVWVGYPHGALTAAAHGLFARPAKPGDPTTSWIPCLPDHPDAKPDISRLVHSGRWNPIDQVFELAEATSRG